MLRKGIRDEITPSIGRARRIKPQLSTALLSWRSAQRRCWGLFRPETLQEVGRVPHLASDRLLPGSRLGGTQLPIARDPTPTLATVKEKGATVASRPVLYRL